jgi:hypothetical protein
MFAPQPSATYNTFDHLYACAGLIRETHPRPPPFARESLTAPAISFN